jgi:hypothetical protein
VCLIFHNDYIVLVILCFIPILSLKFSQAWRLWGENKVVDLMDPTLHEVCNADQFVKCVHIGLLCVQIDPNDRPTISNVVTMLESETGTLPTPKQPTFDVSGLSSTVSSNSFELTNSFEFEGR